MITSQGCGGQLAIAVDSFVLLLYSLEPRGPAVGVVLEHKEEN